ncbi:universal stress protein [Hymenobacter sp. 15J16-1T3B]|uniref:universal stress protein n=1 Tax=Hymenobacter sp. 15J16-1T3B TaxID=2886941 RepID=UPI001D1154B1|nr:universal stress protein [Hymenobacter sp. 15J16-1T3B]MCC3156675.1 universal stress protein [Hymenobacter sp. 15J16-1T3B]
MKPTFVVLTDLSPRAFRAAYFAAVLAAAVGAELRLLHLEAEAVIEPEFGMLPLPADYLDQQQRDATTALAELVRLLPAPAQVQPRRGALADTLQELVRHEPPALLVLSYAAGYDLFDQLLHNYALPALRDTHLPLLLVPEDAAQDPAPPRRVALAVDGEYFRLSPEACRTAALLQQCQPEYTVVHVAEPSGPALDMRSALRTARSGGLLPADAPDSTYLLRHDSRGGGLAQAATDTQADLLVLVSRPRSLLAELLPCTLAATVARHCPVPVLLLPAVAVPVPTAAYPAYDGLRY